MIEYRSRGEGLPRVIDLRGPDGNVYVLMSYAASLCRQLLRKKDLVIQKFNGDKCIEDDIIRRMKSGDYENAVRVFDEEFGDFVTLIRHPKKWRKQ